jgi:alpha-glucosidase
MTSAWWHDAVGYQLYLRSFQDSDGDGIGDLGGIRERLPYLADLGIDLLWITPFYPSPQADHGYDVADYRDIDPPYGSLADADALIDEAHALGLKVVVDLVPNHTSDQHRWFQASLRGEPPYDDYYVWRGPGPDGGPPNNWVSHFGGPAWTYREERGQYYMHLFLPEQPDLDWANEAVRAEFDEILRFWFERGADGFRIDVAHSLTEDPQFRDNPLVRDVDPEEVDPGEVFAAYDHVHDLDQDDVVEVYHRWHEVAAPYDAVLIGEVYLLEPQRLTRYVEDGALHAAFCFPALRTAWDAAEIRAMLEDAVAAGRGRLAWPLSSHDDPRAAERFGGGEVGAQRQLAYFTLLVALPGIPFLYQGDELGLDNGVVSHAEDPIAVRNAGAQGRDGSRTPLPWDRSDHLGFTTGEPWLELGSNREPEQSASAQLEDPGSHLHRMRELLWTRRGLPDLRGDAPVEWLGDGPLVALRRGGTVVACNVGDDPVELPVTGHVRYVSTGRPPVHADGVLTIDADTAVIVTDEPGQVSVAG